MGFIFWIWAIIVFIQTFLNFGTAYRLTKRGSDSGIALWGWLLVLNWAAAVPGLCIYLWHKYKDEGNDYTNSKKDISEW